MTQDRITHADLDWWLVRANELESIFAKTYAATAPHHYVVENRTAGVTHEDMVRAARVIHTFGQPGKYYSLTKIYLVSPDGRCRWWTEDRHFTDTTLVNRATTELFYGVQNAPSTISGIETPFDGIATSWDAEHPIPDGESERVKQLLAGVRGTYPPHVLDIGCGTGRVLDLGLVAPDRYAGVDSSQAMLNLLLRKHPKAAAVYPVEIRSALHAREFTPGQFDWVFIDSSVELSAAEREQVEQIARVAVIVVDETEWTVSDVSKTSVQRILAEHGHAST
jgi:SAM-dependent methyltransferase